MGMRPTPRFFRFAAGLAAIVVGVAVTPATTRADAVIDVTITVRNQPFLAGVTEWEIVVNNPGTETLGALVLTGAGALNSGSITAPTVTTGNADGQLDPGEVWTYSASGPSWIRRDRRDSSDADKPDGHCHELHHVLVEEPPARLGFDCDRKGFRRHHRRVACAVRKCVANFSVAIVDAEARVLDPGSGLDSFDPLTPSRSPRS